MVCHEYGRFLLFAHTSATPSHGFTIYGSPTSWLLIKPFAYFNYIKMLERYNWLPSHIINFCFIPYFLGFCNLKRLLLNVTVTDQLRYLSSWVFVTLQVSSTDCSRHPLNNVVGRSANNKSCVKPTTFPNTTAIPGFICCIILVLQICVRGLKIISYGLFH